MHQTNWAARNASFVERDANATLQGFDDHAHAVEVRLRDGRTHTLVAHDYSELLPLMRHKRDPSHAAVRRMLDKPRDVRLTLDGPLQAAVAQALSSSRRVGARSRRRRRRRRRRNRGGARLRQLPVAGARRIGRGWSAPARRAARPRTLRSLSAGLDVQADCRGGGADRRRRRSRTPTFVCERLADGRVGAHVRGASRPIRDDLTDKTPHGRVDLRKGLVVSCNAYFAQLAMHLGPQAISRAAAPPQIQVSSTPASLRGTLPYAGYGQGEVLASPLRMARAVAAIAGNGSIHEAAHRAAWREDRGDERAVAARP